jgi:hypothetical protein
MGNYTDEEKLAFAKRDREIVRMNALNRATDLIIALKGPMVDVNICVDTIEEVADKFVNWITSPPDDKCKCVGGCAGVEDAHFEPESPLTKNYPIPDPTEMDVLMLIAKELAAQCPDGFSVDFDKVCIEVCRAFPRYPRNKDSVSKAVNGINKNNVFVKGQS